MIISHTHRFVFVHCRKTAGSSVKAALAPYLGPDDLVVGGLNEVLRARGRLNRRMRRDLLHPLAWYGFGRGLAASGRLSEAINRGIKMRYVQALGLNPPHPPAERVAAAFPRAWNEYFKFCFIRNPFSQVVSDYWWRRRMSGADLNFDDFLEYLEKEKTGNDNGTLEPGTVPNWRMYTIDDRIAVDFVGDYDNLTEDFKHVLTQIGIDTEPPIPHEKVGLKTDTLGSAAQLTKRQTERIRRIFDKEIDAFNFKP
jgi:hypothetical protein